MFAAVPAEIENPRSLKTPIGSIEILATSEETQNSFAIIELLVPPHFPGAPLHYHEHMPESMYWKVRSSTQSMDRLESSAQANSQSCHLDQSTDITIHLKNQLVFSSSRPDTTVSFSN